MVLKAGRENVEYLMAGNPAGAAITHIVVGTSATPVTDTDAAPLSGQIMKAITAINYFSNPDQVELQADLLAGDPAMVIQEVGLLNSAGVLCHRKVIAPVNKVAGTTYKLSYKIKVQ